MHIKTLLTTPEVVLVKIGRDDGPRLNTKLAAVVDDPCREAVSLVIVFPHLMRAVWTPLVVSEIPVSEARGDSGGRSMRVGVASILWTCETMGASPCWS